MKKMALLLFILSTITFIDLPANSFSPTDEEEYLVTVQKMPILIGGYESLQKRIKYPEEARLRTVEGKVYILAYINENGECVEAKIVKGIGSGCDEESVRVVKTAKFIPGENNLKKVKSKLTLSIVFKLNF